jgi:hypothetical protein
LITLQEPLLVVQGQLIKAMQVVAAGLFMQRLAALAEEAVLAA